MAQLLVSLAKKPGLVPSTHRAAYKPSVTVDLGVVVVVKILLTPQEPGTHAAHIHIYRQNTL